MRDDSCIFRNMKYGDSWCHKGRSHPSPALSHPEWQPLSWPWHGSWLCSMPTLEMIKALIICTCCGALVPLPAAPAAQSPPFWGGKEGARTFSPGSRGSEAGCGGTCQAILPEEGRGGTQYLVGSGSGLTDRPGWGKIPCWCLYSNFGNWGSVMTQQSPRALGEDLPAAS